MKNTIFLLILVIAFGAVIFKRLGTPIKTMPARDRNIELAILEPKPEHKTPADVREINYFEDPRDVSNWFLRFLSGGRIKTRLSHNAVSQGQTSMEVEWSASSSSELILAHFPQDWSGYRRLKFDIYDPGSLSLDIRLKIGDFFSASGSFPDKKKYEAIIKADPGWNHYDIPFADIGEKVEIDSLRKAIILQVLAKAKKPAYFAVFYLDNMRLTR
jgi:hypothetical protein